MPKLARYYVRSAIAYLVVGAILAALALSNATQLPPALLAEVDQMCDRCVILKEGRKVYEGALGSSRKGKPRFLLETPDTREADAVALKMGATLSKKGYVELPSDVTGPEFVKALVEGGVRVESWGLERQSLEDIYLELTGKKK